MSIPPRFICLCVVALIFAGCHQGGQMTANQTTASSTPATPVAPAPTPTADKAQMHKDAATAAVAMASDSAAMQPTSAAATDMAATTAPTMVAPAMVAPAMVAPAMVAVANMTPSKAATTKPVNNDVTGTVTFTQMGDKVLVVADISGLEPNTKHGIHIHEKGDLSDPGLMSTGGHWNPDHHIHGGPTTSPVHAGDLGNLEADATGKAHLELTLSNVSVGGMHNDVIGHAVIIHARADDLSSQPSGNSGARVAGGIIELQAALAK